MTLEDALSGKEIPQELRETLTLVTVPYFSFTGTIEEGELVIHKELEEDVRAIGAALVELKFPIKKMVPVVAYAWDDDASMADNNTSAFNYRPIAGTMRISQHAYGRAIDINPVQNPYVGDDGTVTPPGAVYDSTKPGTVTPSIASLFKAYGWGWGGDWGDRKDWQHFQKPAHN